MRCPILLLLAAVLSACGTETVTPAEETPATAAVSASDRVPESAPDDPMAKWTRSCVICHVRGEGGAPVVGDRDVWRPRLAQGEDVLLKHTVEGLRNMPPLGYCMDCEEEDFRQLIRFMGGES